MRISAAHCREQTTTQGVTTSHTCRRPTLYLASARCTDGRVIVFDPPNDPHSCANDPRDTLGRLKIGIDADWYPTSFTYDDVDRITQATDRLGKLRDYHFDLNGNPDGQKLILSLYGIPTLVDSSAALYDDADRLQTATDAGGNLTAYHYDPAGNVTSITNPDNTSIGIGYDAANHPIIALSRPPVRQVFLNLRAPDFFRF